MFLLRPSLILQRRIYNFLIPVSRVQVYNIFIRTYVMVHYHAYGRASMFVGTERRRLEEAAKMHKYLNIL